MEKIRDTINKKLPPLRLYMDEVQELYDFISSVAEDVTLRAEGYRLSSPQELTKLPVRHIHNLEIGAERPYIRVQLRNYSAEIYLGYGNVEAQGVAARLESILLEGRAKVYSIDFGFWSYLILWLPVWIGLVLKHLLILGVGIAFVIAYFINFAVDYQFQQKRYTTVLPVQRKEVSSFWERNRDQLLLIVLGALIGSGLTVAAQWIISLL